MKTITKLLSTTALLTTLGATNYQNTTIYNDPLTMGMGNAITASGGSGLALLTNPAALCKSESSWEVGLMDVTIGTNLVSEIGNIVDLGSASDTEMIEYVADKLGDNINLSMNLAALNIAFSVADIHFGLGEAGNLNVNLKPHDNLVDPSGVIEFDAQLAAAGYFNTAYTFMGNLHTGLNLKAVTLASVSEGATLGNMESIGDTVTDALNDSMQTVMLVDFGVIYDIEDLQKYMDNAILDGIIGFTDPSIGLSVLNIGGGTSDSTDGIVPMTINMGLSLKPMGWNWLMVNMDYIDMFNGYEVNSSRGFASKFRMGTSVGANSWWGKANLKLGWMNNAYTAGVDLFVVPLQIALATYQEELGGYVGQIPDRRYMINVGLKF
jgi:hypothetical protein